MIETPMPLLSAVARDWWVLALRGVIAVLFGIMAFVWPALTLAVLILLWGAFALVEGILAVVAGTRERWGSMVLLGVLGIAAGLIALFRPGLTAVALLAVVAAWAILRGAFEIVAAIRLRRELTHEWLLILSGAISIAFGVLVMLFPGAGAISIVWLIGIWAVVTGALLLLLAFRLRRLNGAGVPRPAL